jgi:hypothetical protein
VRIAGLHAAWVQLDALDWQFPYAEGDGDDTWLMIAVSAALGGRTHRRWSFTDACLLMDEARTLGAWLRAAGHGRLPVDEPATQASLTFLEPVLGFALAARETTTLLLRVFFAAEGVPDWARRRNPATEVVDLWVRPDALLDAADEWDTELNSLPPRP